MAERPILFNTEMVRAILDGRKTQTRRLVKNIPLQEPYFEVVDGTSYACDGDGEWHLAVEFSPIQEGDILWVRETWDRYVDGNTGETVYVFKTHSRARKILEEVGGYQIKWRPSIHMPKEAARLFLCVKDVRMERLQDMTEEDAICEGYVGMPWCYHHVFENYPDSPIPCDASSGYDCPPDRPCDKSIPELFGKTIWNPTIKKPNLDRYSWEANPWVWVIEFERTEKPIGWCQNGGPH